jgi:hypothetical protein
VVLLKGGILAFFLFKDWLAMVLPYASVGRRVAVTLNGYFLLVPPDTKEGDAVYSFEGDGSFGFVVRKKYDETQCELVGAANVHMDSSESSGAGKIWKERRSY